MAKAKEKQKPYIEICNWTKAQPKMKGVNNPWLKLYTSLLDNEPFLALDNTSRMLLIALWLYAARSGRHIFPADPDWLMKRIPMITEKPDFGPLMESQDVFGNVNSFVKYCEKPKKAVKKTAKKKVKKTVKKAKIKKSSKNRVEQSRAKQSRADKSTVSLTDTEKKNSKEDNIKTGLEQQTQEKPQQEPQSPTSPTSPTSPLNPAESEAAVLGHHVPGQPCSALKSSGSPHIGNVISGMFPEHWQDPEAEEFGWSVINALGLPNDRGDMNVRSEWGSFAAWFVRLKKTVPTHVCSEMKIKALRKADHITKKSRTTRNRSAVWFTVMKSELNSRGINLIPNTVKNKFG